MVKDSLGMQETWVRSLGWEDPLKEDMATHSSILAWRVPMDRGAWQAILLNKYSMIRKHSHSTVRIELHYLGKLPPINIISRIILKKKKGERKKIVFPLSCSGLERAEYRKISFYGCVRGGQKFHNLLKRSSLKIGTRIGTLGPCAIAGKNQDSFSKYPFWCLFMHSHLSNSSSTMHSVWFRLTSDYIILTKIL